MAPEMKEAAAGSDQLPDDRPNTLTATEPRPAAPQHNACPATSQSVDWLDVPDWPGYQCRPPNHVRSTSRVIETARGPRFYPGVNLRVVGRSVWLYRAGKGRREGRSFCAAALVRDVWGAR